MNVASRVAGHVTADPVIMDTIANAKPIRHHWGEAAEVHGWTGEGAGREDVVVDGRVSRVSVQVLQSLALWVGQVSKGKEVSVKTLAWWEKWKRWLVQQLLVHVYVDTIAVVSVSMCIVLNMYIQFKYISNTEDAWWLYIDYCALLQAN